MLNFLSFFIIINQKQSSKYRFSSLMRKTFYVINYFSTKSALFCINDQKEGQYASYDEP